MIRRVVIWKNKYCIAIQYCRARQTKQAKPNKVSNQLILPIITVAPNNHYYQAKYDHFPTPNPESSSLAPQRSFYFFAYINFNIITSIIGFNEINFFNDESKTMVYNLNYFISGIMAYHISSNFFLIWRKISFMNWSSKIV